MAVRLHSLPGRDKASVGETDKIDYFFKLHNANHSEGKKKAMTVKNRQVTVDIYVETIICCFHAPLTHLNIIYVQLCHQMCSNHIYICGHRY